jgi:hypothetical protein
MLSERWNPVVQIDTGYVQGVLEAWAKFVGALWGFRVASRNLQSNCLGTYLTLRHMEQLSRRGKMSCIQASTIIVTHGKGPFSRLFLSEPPGHENKGSLRSGYSHPASSFSTWKDHDHLLSYSRSSLRTFLRILWPRYIFGNLLDCRWSNASYLKV